MLFHRIVFYQLLFLVSGSIGVHAATFPQGASNKADAPLNHGIDGADTEPQQPAGASAVALAENTIKPSHIIISTIFTRENPNLDGSRSLSNSRVNAQTPTIATSEPTLYASVETLLYTHYYVVQTTTQTSVSEITQEISITDIEASGPKTLFMFETTFIPYFKPNYTDLYILQSPQGICSKRGTCSFDIKDFYSTDLRNRSYYSMHINRNIRFFASKAEKTQDMEESRHISHLDWE